MHEAARRLVLVADNELVFHMIIAPVLATFEFASLSANDGPAAIAAVAAHRNELRGAFLDIAMPAMGLMPPLPASGSRRSWR